MHILNLINDKSGLSRKPVTILKAYEADGITYTGEIPICYHCNKLLVSSPNIECDCELFKKRVMPPKVEVIATPVKKRKSNKK